MDKFLRLAMSPVAVSLGAGTLSFLFFKKKVDQIGPAVCQAFNVQSRERV